MEEKHIELTEEMKKQLKESGSLGYQLDAKFPYIPKSFRVKDAKGDYLLPKKVWTIFFLKATDGVTSAEVEDLQRGSYNYESIEDKKLKGVSMKVHSAKARVETLRRCLIGWKNFWNIDGKLIEDWKKDPIHDGASEESVKFIHPELQVELCNAIEDSTCMNNEELLGLEL